eukprot:63024-Amphidinium_carterae.3
MGIPARTAASRAFSRFNLGNALLRSIWPRKHGLFCLTRAFSAMMSLWSSNLAERPFRKALCEG